MARIAILWLSLTLLVGCKGMEYGLLGAIVPLVAISHSQERLQYPNASTYGEIEGVQVPDSVAASDLLGSYIIPVGSHGGATLSFTTDSTLTYRVYDGFARYDVEVEGSWTIVGNVITLELPPLEVEDGHIISKGHSDVLEIVTFEDRLLLVPLDHKVNFLRFGTAWPVFQRV